MTGTHPGRRSPRETLGAWLEGRTDRVAVLTGPWGIGRSHELRSVLDAARARGDAVGTGFFSAAGRCALRSELGEGDPARVVLGIDDVQLLAADAVTELTDLIRSTPLRAVLTVPSDDALPAWLRAALLALPTVTIALQPLDEPATARLAGRILGAQPTAATTRALWGVSRGIPRLIVGYARGSAAADLVVYRDDRAGLIGRPVASEEVRLAVSGRLGALPPDEREAFQLLALAAPAPFQLLEQVADAGVLERLERRGLLVARAVGQRTDAAAATELDIEVARDELAVSRRRDLSRRLLAVSAAHLRAEDVLRTARWQLDAGIAVDPIGGLVAAEEAMRRGDPELAAALARSVESSRPGAAAALGVAAACLALGSIEAAVAALLRARARADDELTDARATATLAQVRYFQLDEPAQGIGLLDEALLRCGDPDAMDVLESARALLASMSGDLERALAAGRRLHDRTSSQPIAVVSTLTVSSIAAVLLGRFDEVEGQLARAHAAEPAVRRVVPLARMQLLATEAMAAVYTQGGGSTLDALRAAHGEAEAAYDATAIGFLGAVLTHLAVLVGDVVTAEAAGTEALVWLGRADPLAMRANTVAHLAHAAALAGDLAVARRRLAQITADEEQRDIRVAFGTTLARLRVAALQGERTAVGPMAAAGVARLAPTHPVWALFVAHEAARVGCPVVGSGAAYGQAPWVRATVPRLLTDHLHAVQAREGRALERVADRAAAAGLPLLAAETAVLAARSHRRSRDVTGEVRAVYAAQGHAARCPAAVVLGLGEHEWPLTDRETQIARLVSSGATDRAIAAQLGLSARTVSNHLGRTYRKLDIRGRGELAALFSPQWPDGSPTNGGEPTSVR